MKIKVQAQHLQPGDIVGSGEKVVWSGQSISTPKVSVMLFLKRMIIGKSYWGKYTMINVERAE